MGLILLLFISSHVNKRQDRYYQYEGTDGHDTGKSRYEGVKIIAGTAGMIRIVGLKAIGTFTFIWLRTETIVATRHLTDGGTVILGAPIARLAGAFPGLTTIAMAFAFRCTDGLAACTHGIGLVALITFAFIGHETCWVVHAAEIANGYTVIAR